MPADPDLAALTSTLAAGAADADRTGAWPAASIRAAADAGCWRWVIPTAFGGLGLPPRAILDRYEAVAAGCMTTALILTQRDAATDLIAGCDNAALKQELLPALAAGRSFCTVGIAQLTTSKRGPGPALTARAQRDGFVLDGRMPWVTGAAHADVVVTGAVLPSGHQLLAAVDTNASGIEVGPPLELMGLNASHTAAVECRGVLVPAERVIRGPAEVVLAGRAPTRPLVVSVTGIGHARALLELAHNRASRAPVGFTEVVQSANDAYQRVHTQIIAAADRLLDPAPDTPSDEIRIAVNDLLVRLSAVLLTLSKGSGYLRSDPAQRLVREAIFFLVWSAPEAIQLGTLQSLLTAAVRP